MTDRQKRLIRQIRPHLTDIYHEAAMLTASSQVGFTWQFTVPRLVPTFLGMRSLVPERMLMRVDVMKAPDGLRFRIADGQTGKGRTASKWRQLHYFPKSPAK